MKSPSFLDACIGLTILSTGTCASLAVLDLRNLVKQQFQVEQRIVSLADRHAQQIEQDLRLRMDAALEEVKALHGTSGQQLTAALEETAAWRETTDRRLGDAIDRYDATLKLAEKRTEGLLQTAADIRSDLKPALDNTAAAVKDLQESWDDSYNDVRALLGSATVAATQTAQTLEVIRKTAPGTAKDVAGIAADFHDATTNLDMKFFHPPKRTRKQKIVAFFVSFEALLIAALRGGVF